MLYQKPQVLAGNQTDGLYMMPCMVRAGNVASCKPWFLLRKQFKQFIITVINFNKRRWKSMQYQKPQVLAENKINGLYMMPCDVKSSPSLCKFWFYQKFA